MIRRSRSHEVSIGTTWCPQASPNLSMIINSAPFGPTVRAWETPADAVSCERKLCEDRALIHLTTPPYKLKISVDSFSFSRVLGEQKDVLEPLNKKKMTVAKNRAQGLNPTQR